MTFNSTLERIERDGHVVLSIKQAASLRTMFLRWRRRNKDRARLALTARRLKGNWCEVRITEAPDVELATRLNQRHLPKLLTRAQIEEARKEKERRAGKLINTSPSAPSAKLWARFFTRAVSAPAFQICFEYAYDVTTAFAQWSAAGGRDDLKLVADCIYQRDKFMRFYITAHDPHERRSVEPQ